MPHGVTLVGYDDIPLTAYASPPLTTMRTDPIGRGKAAMVVLLAQIENRALRTIGRRNEQVAELILRESCGAYLRRT